MDGKPERNRGDFMDRRYVHNSGREPDRSGQNNDARAPIRESSLQPPRAPLPPLEPRTGGERGPPIRDQDRLWTWIH